MQRWDLPAVEAPDGTRDPIVLGEDEGGGARAVLVKLNPGQQLGDHEVKENAWLVVVEGRVQATSGATTEEAGPGTLFHFAAQERHSVASADGARILLLLAPWPGPGHYRGGDEPPGGS
jgi:quercetin dioxygenase-like cupin family protein